MRTFSDSDRPTSPESTFSELSATSLESTLDSFEALSLSLSRRHRSGGVSPSSSLDAHPRGARRDIQSGYVQARGNTTAGLSGNRLPTANGDDDDEWVSDLAQDEYEIILMSTSSPSSSESDSESIVALSEPSDSVRSHSSLVFSHLSVEDMPSTVVSSPHVSPSPLSAPSTIDLDSDAISTIESDRTVGESRSHLTSRRRHGPASVTTASEAQWSLDRFFEESEEFMSDKANKLRLWQSLCIEFGLVDLEGSVPPSLPNIPESYDDYDSDSEEERDSEGSRSLTPPPYLPSLPTSLTQARLLLKGHAHVNIVEYINARKDPARLAHNGAAGRFADLVYPSANAMLRAMRKGRKFYPLDETKKEWLEPLLKDFGIRRRRN